MRKNQTASVALPVAIGVGPCAFEPRASPQQSQRLRTHLRAFAQRAADGRLPVHLPGPANPPVARGDGHFHLAPELFLQVSGWTLFRFPHGERRLEAGEALLVPPRLLHDEHVGGRSADEAFCNLVIHADGTALSCHMAHEAAPGRPGILHLEASRHLQAARIHDWLRDAASLGADGERVRASDEATAPWAEAQLRSLVTAAVAGVLRVLDDPHSSDAAEPALVARVRMLVQNQLGDPALSVRRLAEASGCGADYLSHVFARTTGEHLAGYIARQRLQRAARLLEDSGMAGKEIAWACGFATPSYFVRSFRERYGVTPQAWRSGRAAAR